MKQRVEHVDIAKGISIALVAMFHSKMNIHFESIIEPMALFRVPLFFFVSGIFFSYQVAPKEFFLKKSEALLKPYLSVLLSIFLLSLVLGHDALGWQFKGIFYGNGPTIKWVALWFLPHLFLVYLFVYFLFYVLKIEGLPYSAKIVLLSTFVIAGSYSTTLFWNEEINVLGRTIEIPGLPFSADLIFITSAYFMAGYFLKEKLKEFKPNIYLSVLSGFTIFWIIFYTDTHTDLNSRIYGPTVLATLAAISGIYLIISLSWLISKTAWLKSVPLKLGRSSLFVLLFHSVVGRHVYGYLSYGVDSESKLVVASVVAFLFSVSIPVIMDSVVRKSEVLSLAFFPKRQVV